MVAVLCGGGGGGGGGCRCRCRCHCCSASLFFLLPSSPSSSFHQELTTTLDYRLMPSTPYDTSSVVLQMMAANNALATDNISFLDISKEIDILTTHAVSTAEISLLESPFALGVASVIVALETLHASPDHSMNIKAKLDFVVKLLVDNHYFNHRDDIAQCISLFHSLQRRNRARARSMKKTEGEESDSVAASVVAALHFVSHLLLSSSFPPPFLLLLFSRPTYIESVAQNKQKKKNKPIVVGRPGVVQHDGVGR